MSAAPRLIRVVAEHGRFAHLERPGAPPAVLDAADCRYVAHGLAERRCLREAAALLAAARWIEDAP